MPIAFDRIYSLTREHAPSVGYLLLWTLSFNLLSRVLKECTHNISPYLVFGAHTFTCNATQYVHWRCNGAAVRVSERHEGYVVSVSTPKEVRNEP